MNDPDKSQSKPVILMADDSSVARSLTRLLFKDEFTVVEASNGQEVLDLLQSSCVFDLLLLDLCMPNLDGWEVLKFLREHGMLATLPVMLVTASAIESETVVNLFESGAWDVVVKPFDPKVLLTRVRSFLSRVPQNTDYSQSAAEELRAALEGAAAAIFAVDPTQYRILRANGRFNARVKRPRTEGFLLSEVTGAAATVFNEMVATAKKNGFSGPVIVDSLAEGCFDSLYCELLRDEHGEPALIVGTLTDMTAVVRRIRELETAES